MKKLIGMATLAGLLLLVAAERSAVAADDIEGKWKAVAMEREGKKMPAPAGRTMIVEFIKGGKFITAIERAATDKEGKAVRREGTWKLNGKKLVTVMDSKTETMTYERAGTKLTLTQVEHSDRKLYLERAGR